MKLSIDEKPYEVDLNKPLEGYRSIYNALRTTGITIHGKTYIMNSTSIARTALKAVMTPIVLPMIRSMYQEQGIILEPPPRHTDLIDYAIHAIIDYMKLVQENIHVNIASKIGDDSSTAVISNVTIEPIEKPGNVRLLSETSQENV